MHDERSREQTAGTSAKALDNSLRVAPSSSRMLGSYLSDVEQLLDEQRWEAALREALDLPQIAVALSDEHLSASSEGLPPRTAVGHFARTHTRRKHDDA